MNSLLFEQKNRRTEELRNKNNKFSKFIMVPIQLINSRPPLGLLLVGGQISDCGQISFINFIFSC